MLKYTAKEVENLIKQAVENSVLPYKNALVEQKTRIAELIDQNQKLTAELEERKQKEKTVNEALYSAIEKGKEIENNVKIATETEIKRLQLLADKCKKYASELLLKYPDENEIKNFAIFSYRLNSVFGEGRSIETRAKILCDLCEGKDLSDENLRLIIAELDRKLSAEKAGIMTLEAYNIPQNKPVNYEWAKIKTPQTNHNNAQQMQQNAYNDNLDNNSMQNPQNMQQNAYEKLNNDKITSKVFDVQITPYGVRGPNGQFLSKEQREKYSTQIEKLIKIYKSQNMTGVHNFKINSESQVFADNQKENTVINIGQQNEDASESGFNIEDVLYPKKELNLEKLCKELGLM